MLVNAGCHFAVMGSETSYHRRYEWPTTASWCHCWVCFDILTGLFDFYREFVDANKFSARWVAHFIRRLERRLRRSFQSV